jgi:hypothetical protein
MEECLPSGEADQGSRLEDIWFPCSYSLVPLHGTRAATGARFVQKLASFWERGA